MSEPADEHPVDRFCRALTKALAEGRPIRVDKWFTSASLIVNTLVCETDEARGPDGVEAVARRWLVLGQTLKTLIIEDQNPHFPGWIEHACTSWWEAMTKAQLRESCPIAATRRAMAAYVLAMAAFRQRDRGTALRWASLGYLADKLGRAPRGGGNEVTLRFGLGLSEWALAPLIHAGPYRTRYPDPVESLPEWCLVKALAQPGGLALVAPSLRYSHHPSSGFVAAAVKYVLSAKGDAAAKGRRLEHLTAFLTSTVPGMRPRLNLRTSEQSAEHDVVAASVGESPYPLPERASEWLIECKNWRKPVSVEIVGHFLSKMVRAGARFGILVVRSGTTGGRDGARYAEAFRRDFCLRHGVHCLVISAAELRDLGRPDERTFRGLIDSKYEAERFGASLLQSP